jgi:hypothetical protein
LALCMDTLGFEPRAFRMRSGCDTTTPCARWTLRGDFCASELKVAKWHDNSLRRSPLWGLNPRPYAYEAYALPTELKRRLDKAHRYLQIDACNPRQKGIIFWRPSWPPELLYFLMFKDTLAERLRRRPAKPMGSARVGSNPTGVDFRESMSMCDSHYNTMCYTNVLQGTWCSGITSA